MSDCLSEETALDFVMARSPASKVEQVEQHIGGCADCRQLLLELANVSVSSHADTVPRVPADAASAALELERGDSLGRYLVVDEVGAGAMGVVYQAYDPELDRRVALKLVRADVASARHQQRLVDEGKTLAKLEHPHVVGVHDVGVWNGRVFIAMQYVEGPNLKTWLNAASRPLSEVLRVLLAAGGGLVAAHAQGVIHRDLKPANILVDSDGLGRITDFGLAARDVDAAPALPHGATVTPGLIGTPGYMALEQLRCLGATAASDQFSFCVTLWEALGGLRPFAGRTPQQIAQRIEAGDFASPIRPIPPKILAVLHRGLAANPADRFPSVSGLLEALERTTQPRGRRVAAVGGVAAIALAATWAVVGSRSEPSCDAGATEIAQVWNEDVSGRLEAAFARTQTPFFADTWTTVESTLSGYASDWAAEHDRACRATRVDGHQSERLLDLRVACLRRRKTDFANLTRELLETTDATIERAVDDAQSLPWIEECKDAASLQLKTPLPADPPTRAGVAATERELSKLATSLKARDDSDLEEAKLLLERAHRWGYAPLVATAWLEKARIHDELGQYDAAQESLLEALWAAERGEDRYAKLEVLTMLVYVGAKNEGTYEQALRSFRHATAMLDSVAAAPSYAGNLHYNGAILLRFMGDYEQADNELVAAMHAYERAGSDQTLEVAGVRHQMGVNAYRKGEYTAALEHLRVASDEFADLLGTQHPTYGKVLLLEAAVHVGLGNYERGLELDERALEIFESTLPQEHADVGSLVGNMGLVLMELERHDEALEMGLRSLAIVESNFGGSHPSVGLQLSNVGLCLIRMGRLQEALDYLSRARAVFVDTVGEQHPDMLVADSNLAYAYRKSGNFADATRHAQGAIDLARTIVPGSQRLAEALEEMALILDAQRQVEEAKRLRVECLEILDAHEATDEYWTARLSLDLGWNHLELDEPQLAKAALERAVESMTRNPETYTDLLPHAQFMLAQALRLTADEPARACALAGRARASFVDLGAKDEASEVDAWMARCGT